MLPKAIIALVSGGLDSVVGLYDLVAQGHHVHAAIVHYGQAHDQETQWAIHHCHRLNVLYTTFELPQLKGSILTDGKGTVVVPGRNAIFLSLAVNLAVSAGADTVVYFCNKEDETMFPDCRMAFVQAFNHLLLMQELNIEVCTPYIDKAKWEIADLGRQLGVKFEETWSCYKGGKEPCGKCPACLKREEALENVRPH